MKISKLSLMAVLSVSLVVTSCVPSRMFDDLKVAKLKCDEENAKLKGGQLENTTKIDELEKRYKPRTVI
ncbi:MAG: hypothetical protein IPP34_21005 [Bacteroidetes bacterium]|nr:hypothetical protein [Bacteroidota bacterium]